MPVDGKCPRCAYKAPVSCFGDAAEGGAMMQAFAELAYEVQKPFFKYLSLFRPASGCAIQPTKAERLTRELATLVAKGWVSEQGKADRPCPPALWVMGMERMQELAGTLDLPMKNHNYLRSIVYTLANQADAGRERNQHQQVLNGNAKAHRDLQPPAPVDDGLSQLERQYLARYGSLPGMDGDATAPGLNGSADAWKKRDGQGGRDGQ